MDQLQGTLADGDIRIFETLHDGCPVTLYGSRVDLHHLAQCVEGHVPYVVVSVQQESEIRRRRTSGGTSRIVPMRLSIVVRWGPPAIVRRPALRQGLQ